MIKTYLFGGRAGDAIYGMQVPAWRYKTRGEKAAIFLADCGDKWANGLLNTFFELKPIMAFQPWCESFDIWSGQPTDFRMAEFRNHPRLFRQTFTATYFDLFCDGERPDKDFVWMEYLKNEDFKDHLIVCRNYRVPESDIVYGDLVSKYEKSLYLNVSGRTLSDVFQIIGGCKYFAGDQSAPSAIAQALGKPRQIELNRAKRFLEGEASDKATYFSNGLIQVP